jgi:glycosyltransferase involved in cell wall biosynthesis
VDVAVVQPAVRDAMVLRDGVAFHFVCARGGLRRGPPHTRPVPRGAKSISRAVSRLNPRILHVQGLSLPGHGRALKLRLPGVRLMAQDHGDRLPRPWRRPSAKRDFAAFDAVAFTAAAQARPFFEAGLFPPRLPVHEVLESSITHGEPCHDRPPRAADAPRSFIWLGRLDHNKDPLTVLGAFAAVADRFPGARLRMCWVDAPLLGAVRAMVEFDPVLRSRVDLLGACSATEVWRMLCESDFILQGSLEEGSGYAIIEALAAGVTPIVTDIPSFRAIVGDAGFLWSPRDLPALIGCLEHAATIDRNAYALKARDRFDRHLSWDAVGRQLANAYEAVLAGRTATAAGGVA